MNFEIATASRIVFGPGTARDAGGPASEFGRHAFVVTGRDPRRAANLLANLEAARVATTVRSVAGEPTVDAVAAATAEARAAACDCVIGLGGGSVLDAAKAVAVLVANPGEVLDYLEVVGRGRPLARRGLPCIAIPTTAGTGAEVTRNAVLGSPAHQVKVSLRSPYLLPRLAVVDPDLTRGLPPPLTATTGLDALTQLIEAYVSLRANPFADGLCVEGLRRVARSLRPAFRDGGNDAARGDLALASLFSGLALANAGLGAVHGLAGPLGGRFAAPHGAVCAALLPAVMEINLRAVRARAPASGTVARYTEVARQLTGDAAAAAEAGVAWVRTLVADLHIPGLATYGVEKDHLPALAAQAAASSSMKANPLPLPADELVEVLDRSL